MECDRSNITVLIVDNDDNSLEYLANIFITWQYQVQTAKTAHQALVTLQDSEGLFDLIIAELYMSGMNGFDFLKLIKDQFHIPLILMSKENNVSLISKALENGAAQYIAKPYCAEDFKDIWKYALDAKKEKLFVESLFVKGGEQETLSHETKTKKKPCKKKCSDEYQGEESQVVKKPKLVWTTYLHNLFLLAIKQIGLEKAVPKKILDIMNIPNLTRENVASHLQKYRIFLRDVSEKGMVGGISHRALRSRFASSLPLSLVKEFQTIRTNKLRTLNPEYLQTLSYRARDENNTLNPDNQFPTNCVDQFPFVQKDPTLQDLDKVRFGKSKLETDFVDHDQNMFGLYSSSLLNFETKNLFNDGASTSFSPHGSGQGFRPYSSSFITRDLKFGDINYQNHSSIRNDSFNHINHGVKNHNLESLMTSSYILPQNVASDVRNNNPFRSQINNGLETDGIETMNKTEFNSVGKRSDTTNYNSFGIDIKCQSKNINRNIMENQKKYNGVTFTSKDKFNQVAFNISDFLMANDKNLLNEEKHNSSGFLKSTLYNSFQCVKSLEQLYKGGDDASPPAETTSCVLNESPINSDQNFNKLQVHEGFSNGKLNDRFMEEKVSKTCTSTIIDPELNMDLIETLFGTIEN